MRFSVCIDTGRPWADQLAVARRADAAGYACIYVPDHFIPYDPDRAVAGDVHECWTVLSALALATDTVGLGTLVLGGTYRHPAVVANMAATLDQVSGGRVVLGLGAGWQANEHTAYGIDLPEPKVRLDRFEEAVQVISLLLRSEVADFDGEHYRLTGARCQPPPVQERLPLLVGGAGERRTIPLAGRYADAWHTWAEPGEFARRNELLDEACVAAGREPSDVRRLTGQVLRVVDRGEPVDDEEDIIGPAGFVAERLTGYREARVDEFIVRDHAATPLPEALESLSALADLAPPLQ